MRVAPMFTTAAVVLAITTPLAAQVRDTPQVRDAVKPRTGTAIISGRVIDAETPEKGVRRVTVMLGAGDQIKMPVNVMTDEAGRFTFTALAAGAYTLTANRAGYVASTYGAKTPGRAQGATIALADGQRVDDITLPMWRGAAISGVVRLPNGKPAADVDVTVLSAKRVSGEQRLNMTAAPSRTDDRGMYRVYGLAAGDYIVRADVSIQARIEQLRSVTKEEIEWAQRVKASSTNAASAAQTALPPAPALTQPMAYASVYYPGAADPASAVTVTLRGGEDHDGVDIATLFVPTATISGKVLGVDGLPAAGVQVKLERTKAATGIADMISNLIGNGAARSANGDFSMTNIAPGRYRLIARGKPATPAAAPAAPSLGISGIMGMMGGGGAGLTLWADQEIDVNGTDISGLSLRLQPGMTVSGRVTFETSAAQPPDPSRVRIGFAPETSGGGGTIGETVTRMMSSTSSAVQKDGTFSVNGLSPDRYRPSFTPPNMMMPPPLMPVPPGGFVLKSAMLDGKDIADLTLDIKAGEDVKDLVVTFTDRLSEISGTLQDALSKPVVGYPIVVFSTNRSAWSFGSRRIAQARPASDGKYKILGLPAGEYYVCALTDLDMNDLYDPAFLEQLVAGSFKITLADGEVKTQDLKLGGGA